MGWFDPPAIALRKRVPANVLGGFNAVEEYALQQLRSEPDQHRPYQLGIVLALWIKAGELGGEIRLEPRDTKKVQSIYESGMRVLRGNSFPAFCILRDLAEENEIFGVPPGLYHQLAVNVAGVA